MFYFYQNYDKLNVVEKHTNISKLCENIKKKHLLEVLLRPYEYLNTIAS